MSIARILETVRPAVLVRIAHAKGSTPREAGTVMAVSPDRVFGTIGGGQFEWLAIDHARDMLAGKTAEAQLDIPLGADIGQCCGGRVVLTFEPVTDGLVQTLGQEEASIDAAAPDVCIFGAGHVGRALAEALIPLPVTPIVHDARECELAQVGAGIRTRLTALPEADVRAARPGSAIVVLTHDHALDFIIVKEALGRRDFPYVGLIGSKTKRAMFKTWFRREGGAVEEFARLVCPIGASAVSDKRPAVIAALAAAEIITTLGAANAARGTQDERTDATT